MSQSVRTKCYQQRNDLLFNNIKPVTNHKLVFNLSMSSRNKSLLSSYTVSLTTRVWQTHAQQLKHVKPFGWPQVGVLNLYQGYFKEGAFFGFLWMKKALGDRREYWKYSMLPELILQAGTQWPLVQWEECTCWPGDGARVYIGLNTQVITSLSAAPWETASTVKILNQLQRQWSSGIYRKSSAILVWNWATGKET